VPSDVEGDVIPCNLVVQGNGSGRKETAVKLGGGGRFRLKYPRGILSPAAKRGRRKERVGIGRSRGDTACGRAETRAAIYTRLEVWEAKKKKVRACFLSLGFAREGKNIRCRIGDVSLSDAAG